MRWNTERLYALLPSIYRIRDQAQGEPLKAVLDAIAQQVALLDEDLDQLYDDQFIETCADWVVPYIGDLIGYEPIHHTAAQLPTPRAEVANTIAYRRRKGTVAVLEQLALDVTGWKAHGVEFFQQLTTTQHLNHLRLNNSLCPDLRRWRPLEQLDTAFNQIAHTADVRRIASGRGRYNIPNVGVFVWRLQAYPVQGVTARQADRDRSHWFNPLGISSPLFNFPRTETTINQRSQPINLPHPLSRRELYQELEDLRQAQANRLPVTLHYFHPAQPVFQVSLDGVSIPPAEVLICNLTEARTIPNRKSYRAVDDAGVTTDIELPIRVAVDPVIGLLTLAEFEGAEQIDVNYTYGFSHDIGGGPYDRNSSALRGDLRPVTWQVGVSQTETSPQLVFSLAAAINAWNAQAETDTVGIIAILDSHSYTDSLPVIELPSNSQLMIVAADWPIANPTAPPEERRILGQLAPLQTRPHIFSNLIIQGQAAGSDNNNGEVFLNGLLLEGAVQLRDDALHQLYIDHCTLTMGLQRTSESPAAQFLDLKLNGVICGSIVLPQQEATLTVRNSLLDSALPQFATDMTGKRSDAVITALLAHLDIQTSTLWGPVNGRSIEASNSIFLNQVTTVRRQVGCVRFSYLPLSSLVPRRYQCQPSSTTEEIRVQPQFTSVRYGNPAYGQLCDRCPLEIRQGADDESEMGAFHDLFQPQRETNLRIRLDEYLRFGLAAGIVYAT